MFIWRRLCKCVLKDLSFEYLCHATLFTKINYNRLVFSRGTNQEDGESIEWTEVKKTEEEETNMQNPNK
jgi:hypothetical protein